MRLYIILFIFSFMLNAEETLIKPPKLIIKNSEKKDVISPISELLAKIKTSKSDNRRVLINQLKLQLREMNKEKREETMQRVKKTLAKDCKGKQHTQKRHQKRHQHQTHKPQFRPMNGMRRGGNK